MPDPAPGTVDALLKKAQAVVDAISDEETNHGGLLSRETLVKVGHLRLELSGWSLPGKSRDVGGTDATAVISGGHHPQGRGQLREISTESTRTASPDRGDSPAATLTNPQGGQ